MEFAVPGKGIYEGIALSPPEQGEPINISGLVRTFRYEQGLPDEDGTRHDIIVLTGESLLYPHSQGNYTFHTAFDGDLPSVRRLTFLPLSENDRRYHAKTLHFPETFLPTEPHIVGVGILERTTERRDRSGVEYTVVLQVF